MEIMIVVIIFFVIIFSFCIFEKEEKNDNKKENNNLENDSLVKDTKINTDEKNITNETIKTKTIELKNKEHNIEKTSQSNVNFEINENKKESNALEKDFLVKDTKININVKNITNEKIEAKTSELKNKTQNIENNSKNNVNFENNKNNNEFNNSLIEYMGNYLILGNKKLGLLDCNYNEILPAIYENIKISGDLIYAFVGLNVFVFDKHSNLLDYSKYNEYYLTLNAFIITKKEEVLIFNIDTKKFEINDDTLINKKVEGEIIAKFIISHNIILIVNRNLYKGKIELIMFNSQNKNFSKFGILYDDFKYDNKAFSRLGIMFLKQDNKWAELNIHNLMYKNVDESKLYYLINQRLKSLSYCFCYEDIKISENGSFNLTLVSYKYYGYWGYIRDDYKEFLFDETYGQTLCYKSLVTFGSIYGQLCYIAPEEIMLFSYGNEYKFKNKITYLNYDYAEPLTRDLILIKENGKYSLGIFKFVESEYSAYEKIKEIKKITIGYDEISIVYEDDFTSYLHNDSLVFVHVRNNNEHEILCIRGSTGKYYIYDRLKLKGELINFGQYDYSNKNFILITKFNGKTLYNLIDYKLDSRTNGFITGEIVKVSRNYSIISNNNRYAVINSKGDFLIDYQDEEIVVVGNTLCYIKEGKYTKFPDLKDDLLISGAYPKSKKIRKEKTKSNIENNKEKFSILKYNKGLLFLSDSGNCYKLEIKHYILDCYFENSLYSDNELFLASSEFNNLVAYKIIYNDLEDLIVIDEFKIYEALSKDEYGVYEEKTENKQYIISSVKSKLVKVDYDLDLSRPTNKWSNFNSIKKEYGFLNEDYKFFEEDYELSEDDVIYNCDEDEFF